MGSDPDHDLGPRMVLLEVANRLRGFAQGVRAVYDRRDLARLGQLTEVCEVFPARCGDERGQALAYEAIG
jgi:hypothetical protein